jgi:membrane peptidoglycan carboxypeptidase
MFFRNRPRTTSPTKRRTLRLLIGAEVFLIITSGGVVAYASSIDLPTDPVVPQASVLYYRDGRTVLARVGVDNHTDVPLAQVPMVVRQAVLAAEDRGFASHVGISTRGMARAAWTDVTGGGAEGASTITQQYARNAYLTRERSITRKAREILLATKLEERYSKDEILERYLNTIYFGRGAYGIAAAAHAYFAIRRPWWNAIAQPC